MSALGTGTATPLVDYERKPHPAVLPADHAFFFFLPRLNLLTCTMDAWTNALFYFCPAACLLPEARSYAAFKAQIKHQRMDIYAS